MIVLDASALVDVVLDQPSAAWVLVMLRGTSVCAPAHQPAEVLSAVGGVLRAGQLDEEGALAALDEAAALRQELVVPEVQHLRIAMGLRHRIRLLDGLYVALAQQRQAPLVTTDARFARAQLPVEVRWPGAGEPEQREAVDASALASDHERRAVRSLRGSSVPIAGRGVLPRPPPPRGAPARWCHSTVSSVRSCACAAVGRRAIAAVVPLPVR